MIRATTIVTLFVATSSSFAAEREFECTIDGTSVINADAGISLPLVGSWIGNFDAATNPTGTQTRPGLFGGSGNVAIPFSSVVNPAVVADGAVPTGGFGLRYDDLTGVMSVDGFSLDLFGADAADLVARLTLTYPTFRTFSPNSFYVGVNGLTIPLPLGELSKIVAEQTGPAGGVAVPQGDGTSTFAFVIPCDFTIQASAMGQSIDQVIPAAFVLSGRLEPKSGGVLLTTTVALEETTEIPAGLPPLKSQPVGLPTILPPGSTANLLVTGKFGAGTASIAVDGSLVATGTPVSVPGDMNGDG
ncbi:MAG: hypothetical protein FJ254_09235, partial [Phycisphaerae bacterium]|nr:hypothetical protein [Phycisphaerae bacterium]